jgi:PKD repeat protein
MPSFFHYTIDVDHGPAPLTVNVAIAGPGVSGTYLPVWDWGDGSPTEISVSATHTYTNVGAYNIHAIVTPSAGPGFETLYNIPVTVEAAALPLDYTLVPSQNAQRVRLQTAASQQIRVIVGNTAHTWINGTYIEVLHVSGGTGFYFEAAPGATLNALSAGITTLQVGEYGRVSYLGGNVWDLHIYPLPVTIPAIPNNLDDLTNVTVPSPSVNDHLVWNGSAWINQAPSAAAAPALTQLTDVSITSPNFADLIMWNGTHWVTRVSPSLSNLNDVSISNLITGQSITWNGGSWVNQAVSSLPVMSIASTVLITNGSSAQWQSPIFKPAPMNTVNFAGTALDFGKSAHHNSHYRTQAATNITITIRPDTFWSGFGEYWQVGDGPMPVGGSALISKSGAGNITFVAASGVTLNTPDSLTLSTLHGKITLIKVGTNEWDIEGHLDIV